MDPALKRRLASRFGERLIAPIHQRHDETEIRIGPGDVPDVCRTLHDEVRRHPPGTKFHYLVNRRGSLAEADITSKVEPAGVGAITGDERALRHERPAGIRPPSSSST